MNGDAQAKKRPEHFEGQFDSGLELLERLTSDALDIANSTEYLASRLVGDDSARVPQPGGSSPAREPASKSERFALTLARLMDYQQQTRHSLARLTG